jgi:hypothetical protein
MFNEYHSICNIQYYLWFHVTMVGLGKYYPRKWGHYHTCKNILTFALFVVTILSHFCMVV